MVVKLYTAELSPPVRATMMACAIFNVPYENVEVNLIEKEQMQPAFLEKNPLQTVPVLEDGDFILHDSQAILMYLADTYGTDDSWYPKDTKQRALVNQKLFFNTAVLFPKLKNITYALVTERKQTQSKKWLDNIEEGYGFVEIFLSKTAYIATDNITIADLSTYSNMSCLAYVVPVDENKYPKTVQWCTDMENQPFCKEHNNPAAAMFGDLLKECRTRTH
ncbi:glutathione S-transferase 1-like [Helicoverpa armigera]|uniref:glutathione S-transferase 1-like n=1 Tax=Helicoverpa armigera TaxID=29058 RepID=UPI000DAB21A1|nr:hypothetical protein B5X24_HaOG200214 [Helicoverpa armigera]